ncbi:MAG: geranylgeranylglyceryl/heptaprenylglyceryl phosphate synthase [Bacteroidetes bacterium]|nr:geranylgeranylglyceryl/heptaprenylglyceryl phosphate synthase [Bacteroidota bacterium]
MAKAIYQGILKAQTAGKKQLALLIDPDKYSRNNLVSCLTLAHTAGVGLLFIGGSLLVDKMVNETIRIIRENSDLPIIIFPGSTIQFTEEADAILFLSLISGRNADLLIGRHVEVAPFIKKSGIEVIPTGYMLIDGGAPTTASYISNTFPIPHDKPEIAASTAIAGELLGLKMIYLDAGSGAKNPISSTMIEMVKQNVSIPIIVGGGMRTKEAIENACTAGADVVVVGNIIEENPELILHFGEVLQKGW